MRLDVDDRDCPDVLHLDLSTGKEEYIHILPDKKDTKREVRKALLSGQFERLHLLLGAQPQVQLCCFEIFDQRYPGFVLGHEQKSCVKMLLARGAKLGKCAPSSKLLRKVEADSERLWLLCFMRSMSLAGMDLPDSVQQHVKLFI